MMNEYIRSVFLLDEAVTLLVVEPLDSSVAHENILLS
jgi:hypothetical protein